GPREDEGRIELPLGRKDATRGWWMKPDPAGQPAVTTWKVLGRVAAKAPALAATDAVGGAEVDPPHASADGVRHRTWLALELLTGRTHQLRVHCAAMGWPIVGDSVYGGAPRTRDPGLLLHARETVVPLYKNRAPIRVTAPVPPYMEEALRACGWTADDRVNTA